MEYERLDITPVLPALPVFYPDAELLVEAIYREMNGLTRGTCMPARHLAKGFLGRQKLGNLEERRRGCGRRQPTDAPDLDRGLNMAEDTCSTPESLTDRM